MMHKKNSLLALLLFLMAAKAGAQTTLTTAGKYLLDKCGDTVLLRGVDYAPYNWGYTAGEDWLPEIAQTGANCVRMDWYADGGGATEYTPANLDSVLTICKRNKMISILELHDQTCQNDTAALLALDQWFTQPANLSVLLAHQDNLIINLANECLYHNWDNQPAQAAVTYRHVYSAIIQGLRSSGINFPVMLDAPDCGTDISLFSIVGSSIVTSDPAHNVIFSAHAYWYGYAGNDSLQMRTLIQNASSLNIPVVLGEFANTQDDTVLCEWNLPYKVLLHSCQAYQFPWICWGWDHDGCAERQISSNGHYNALTTYGNDIVNNPVYGLHATAVRSSYLLHNGCNSTGIPVPAAVNFPSYTASTFSPGLLTLHSLLPASQTLTVYDLLGRIAGQCQLEGSESQTLSLVPGIYILENSHHDRNKVRVY